jgi:hypothetical protein
MITAARKPSMSETSIYQTQWHIQTSEDAPRERGRTAQSSPSPVKDDVKPQPSRWPMYFGLRQKDLSSKEIDGRHPGETR